MTAAQGRGAARIGVGTAALNSAMLVAILWMALGRAALAAEPKNVLVLYSNNRLVPGNIAVDRGLRAALPSPPDRPVQLFSEFLDQPDFGGEAYERTVMPLSARKVRDAPSGCDRRRERTTRSTSCCAIAAAVSEAFRWSTRRS